MAYQSDFYLAMGIPCNPCKFFILLRICGFSKPCETVGFFALDSGEKKKTIPKNFQQKTTENFKC